MPLFITVESRSTPPPTQGWSQVHQFKSKNTVRTYNGKNYTIFSKEQRIVSKAEQTFYKILNILIFGILAALSKNVKNICTKGKETRRFALLAKNSTPSIPVPLSPKSTSTVVTSKTLVNEAEVIAKMDALFNTAKEEIEGYKKELADHAIQVDVCKEKHLEQKAIIRKAKERLENGIPSSEVNQKAQSYFEEAKEMSAEGVFTFEECKKMAEDELKDVEKWKIRTAEQAIVMLGIDLLNSSSFVSLKNTEISSSKARMERGIAGAGRDVSQEFSSTQTDKYTRMLDAVIS